jgi:aspartyl-tRNA(Asn)/glutamyl-tRNA(Gln) amidotransferase subunit B
MQFEPVIGLEVHAELATQSKMFCACAVVDSTTASPNSAVCPICSGMPGTLPVINQRAVEFALRVGLALECTIAPQSIFARKNYFYPDLPKGYQISQYEQPLARNGQLKIRTAQGEQVVRIRRVHLEEDTGKLTHIDKAGQSFSLIDLNRAGIPLLEIVSEPDLHNAEVVKAYAMTLRSLLRYLDVNTGDMQKGVLRIEPNVSVRPTGSDEFGTRTEIKNLNSFRALERSVAYEIERQSELIRLGKKVIQETRGWDDARGETFSQRVKEEAEDYRYFPEPDLPPLVIEAKWLERVRSELPELPMARQTRFQAQYGLGDYDAKVLTEERLVADYFERVLPFSEVTPPKIIANWITGELFGLLNQAGIEIDQLRISPSDLAKLIQMVEQAEITQASARIVLSEMFASGRPAAEIVTERGLNQISDERHVREIVERVLQENPEQVRAYLDGKAPVLRWLFGQVMRQAGGRANPAIIDRILHERLVENSAPKPSIE